MYKNYLQLALLGLMAAVLITGCAKLPGISLPKATQAIPNNTDMRVISADGTAAITPNNAIAQEVSPGVFLMNSGPGGTIGMSQLGPNPTMRYGGKSFLGFPEYDRLPITTSSYISFTRTAIAPVSKYNNMYFNLIVDSGCDGTFGAGDAIVAFSTGNLLNVTLDQNSTVIGMFKGTIPGITLNVSKLANLAGKCIINADTQDNGMPWGKKMAGVLIVVGDSSGLMNNTSFTISNMSRSF
jgi:hypothetical protein